MMFFKKEKKKWYLITYEPIPGLINHSTIKAKNKGEAWHKLEKQWSKGIEMIRIEEYEDA